VERTANEVDWNCDGALQQAAVAVNLNNTWRYTGNNFSIGSNEPCSSDGDCLGGGCLAGTCAYRSHEASAAIVDLFPGFDDYKTMDFAFQCHASGDATGIDLPVFSAN
jgi:hypothetical protein